MVQFINLMENVSLGELDEVALQNRIDNKYVLNKQQLELIIPIIQSNYKVLKIDRFVWTTRYNLSIDEFVKKLNKKRK